MDLLLYRDWNLCSHPAWIGFFRIGSSSSSGLEFVFSSHMDRVFMNGSDLYSGFEFKFSSRMNRVYPYGSGDSQSFIYFFYHKG